MHLQHLRKRNNTESVRHLHLISLGNRSTFRLQVALQEAAVRVKMELVNRVTDVVVKAHSLPLDGTEVSVPSKVLVELETQDGRGLPWEAALEGLTLKLTPPGMYLSCSQTIDAGTVAIASKIL